MTLATPTLRTARLRLRPFAGADAERLFALHSSARVMRYWDSPVWDDAARAERFIVKCGEVAEEGTGARVAIDRVADGAVLGSLELSGGYFDGPAGSVDTTHPVIGALTAVGFDASDACEPTGEAADTDEPEGGLVLAVRVLTGLTLTAADFEGPWAGGVSEAAS
ncbi:GNAT family N-acetyltransferase [Streptomyces sp. NPDC001661]